MSVAGLVAIATTGLLLPAAPRLVAPRAASLRRDVSMQYDQGYGAQQYGQQGGYAGQQQQQGALWCIYPVAGVSGHTRFQAFGPQYASATQKYSTIPYALSFSEYEFVLGRWNMMSPSPYVSRQQCLVQLLQDGNAMLTSTGKPATGVRARGGQWNALYTGQTHYLSDGDEVALDAQSPDSAVFTFEHLAMQGFQQ